MSEWKEVQIKNIVLGHRPVTYGIVQPGPDIRPDGIPLIRGKDYSSGKVDISDLYHVRPEIDIPYKRSKVSGGDILFSIAGYVGQVAVVPKKLDGANITQTTARISVDLYSYCSEYIFYYLISDLTQTQVRKYAKGSAQEGLNLSDVEKIKIKFPDYSIQRKIARILFTADAVIEKTQATIAKYKAIKQGMLHDLFTCGIDPATGKLRPTYEDAPELYKESRLGWIPKEWEEKPLKIYSTQIGDGIHTTPKYSENTDYYFVNGNNLSEGQIEIGDTALCVSEVEYKKHFKELNERTILYSINGTIGNIALYKNEKIILGKSACYISCKHNVNLDFIYFFLQSFQVNKFYENELTGSTIKNLSLASVRNTPITISKDDTEQELIANRIRTITNKIQTEQNYLHKLQQIKAGLMADLLSGKKKVNVDEEPVN